MLMGRARLAVHLQVVRSLKQLESESFGNGAVVEVRDVDYNLLGLEEQIKNDLETDVMVRSCLGCCDVQMCRVLLCGVPAVWWYQVFSLWVSIFFLLMEL